MSHAGITRVPQVHNPERTGSQIRTDESTLNTEHNIWDGPASVNLVVRPTSRRPSHFQGCGTQPPLHRIQGQAPSRTSLRRESPSATGALVGPLQGRGNLYRSVQLIRRDRLKKVSRPRAQHPATNW